MTSDIPPPAVSPALYDEAYYRHRCAGAETWEASGGAEIDGLYLGMAERSRIQPGDVVVDLGTGRGEFLVSALQKGATRAIGVEYSEDALRLARQTLQVHSVADRAEAVKADVRRVPVPDQSATLVTMLDVIEHLRPDELSLALTEAFRILQPGGRLFAHTFPTRTLYDVTYRLQRLLIPGRKTRWPADPRLEIEKAMHVNEQTLRGLRRTVKRAGFHPAKVSPGRMVYTDFIPDERAKRIYGQLVRLPVGRRFAAADLWLEAVRPSS